MRKIMAGPYAYLADFLATRRVAAISPDPRAARRHLAQPDATAAEFAGLRGLSDNRTASGGTGNNRAVSTATASSFLNSPVCAVAERDKLGRRLRLDATEAESDGRALS